MARPVVYTPPGDRPFWYDGVLASRCDQSASTGTDARFGHALYYERNPFSSDLNRGYDVTVSEGQVAEFTPWCNYSWFEVGDFDEDCALHKGE